MSMLEGTDAVTHKPESAEVAFECFTGPGMPCGGFHDLELGSDGEHIGDYEKIPLAGTRDGDRIAVETPHARVHSSPQIHLDASPAFRPVLLPVPHATPETRATQ